DFLPKPICQDHVDNVIRRFAAASHPSKFEEGGCSVCGQLCVLSDLSALSKIANMIHILEADGVTRQPRLSLTEPVQERKGPMLDSTCNRMVCSSCRLSIHQGKVPQYALCKGLWLGEVPPELQELTFYECILISCVRHSKCFICIQQGCMKGEHSKLITNVIAYENPTPKIYD
ncbi:hypothetical protein GYMLUDRAFT_138704, partial [Collybiopsis luxurians FD-317 M1]